MKKIVLTVLFLTLMAPPAHAGFPILELLKTPFEVMGVTEYIQKIQQFKSSIEEAKNMKKAIGDPMSLLNKGGSSDAELENSMYEEKTPLSTEAAKSSDAVTKLLTENAFVKDPKKVTVQEKDDIQEFRATQYSAYMRRRVAWGMNSDATIADNMAKKLQEIDDAMEQTDESAGIFANTTVIISLLEEELKQLDLALLDTEVETLKIINQFPLMQD